MKSAFIFTWLKCTRVFLLLAASSVQAAGPHWESEGTFDASALPAGTAFNVFSPSTAIDLVDVNFSHTVSANEDLSILTLNEGQFTINASNGDQLQGIYEDFVYSLDAETQQYDGVGDYTFTGGTGMFSDASGSGFWSAIAAFTSATGGTADHEWTNRLNLPNIAIDWSSEGTFDARSLPAGTAVNSFSSSPAFNLGDVQFSHVVTANEDLSVLTLNNGVFEIPAENGDVLQGSYEDFVYTLQEDGATYNGAGDFLIAGGTGLFAGATGQGSWEAVAAFTSAAGGTADHEWTGILNLVAPHPGDFQTDGVLDSEDLQLLLNQLASQDDNPEFDLNGDSQVNGKDVKVWIKEFKNTWIGDANLDGEFNAADLTAIFEAGKFRQDSAADWFDGDWTGDNRFNTRDLIAAFKDGGYNSGKRPSVQSVPEPNGFVAALVAASWLVAVRRYRWTVT